METRWYYTEQGQRLGPVSSTQLKQLAASGRLQPSDMLWKEGMAQWAAASQVNGLFSAATKAATVPPPIPVPSTLTPDSSDLPQSSAPSAEQHVSPSELGQTEPTNSLDNATKIDPFVWIPVGCVVVIGVIVFIVWASLSGPDLPRIIGDHYKSLGEPVQNVTVIGTPQTFPDSWRSPTDSGTAFTVLVRVTLSTGETEQKNLKVFVAKSDGWTAVEDRARYPSGIGHRGKPR